MGGTQAAASRAPQDERAAGPEAVACDVAKVAAKSDRLTPGQYFAQPKPTRPAKPEEPQTIDGLVAFYRERDDLLPAYVQKKYDGVRVQIHRTAAKVRVITEDGEDVTARLPATVTAIRHLRADPLVLDAELERWEKGRHLPREAMSGYLNEKGAADDGDVTANVFDALWFETDLHREPLDVRLRALDKIKLSQKTMAVPSSTSRLNAAPSVRVTDLQALERAVRMISKLPGSEGVVIKQAESTYPLEQRTQDTWTKYHNAVALRGTVLGRTKTAGNAYVHQWGLAAGDVPEGTKTVLAGGQRLVPVGDTFASARRLDPGEGIIVEVEQLNVTRGDKGLEVSGWVPRVLGTYTGRPDSVETATRKARAARVLREKQVEGGEVRYLPQKHVEKAADPYLEIPPEDKPHRFVVQNHWRGKSLHADVRLEIRPNLLVGWTLNTQIAGVVKEPVTTLEQAEAWRKRMAEVSKIDWTTGKWAEREKRGADKPVRTSILSETKGPQPHAWLSVEGVSKPPKEGEPPPVGATRQFPAVYSIEDSGRVEWGAQKPWLHEYFFHGDALNYRVFWRLLQLGEIKKGLHSHERCMHCERAHPSVDVIWADGRGRAWFCDRCFPQWLARMGGRRGAEIVRERRIVGPAAPANFGEVHKAVEVSKAAEPHPLAKLLPPSEEPERDPRGRQWLAIYPDDPVPYVLSNEAVSKAWMPPVGVSALPVAIRAQIPAELRYWRESKPTEARAARDELHKAIKADKIKVDWQRPYGRETRKAADPARFVLQEQTWRGPFQVRTGPTQTVWWLRFDLGAGPLVVLRLYGDPRKGGELAADFSRDRHRDAMKLEGAIKPGHWLNPSKDTPSEISILDTGSAEVLSLSPDSLQVRLKGSTLSGLFGATRENGEWLWTPAKVSEARGVAKQAEQIASASRFVPVLKVDKAKRLVTGVVLEPGEVDAHRDIVPAEVVERAAHRFLARFNSETRLGLMHKRFGEVGLELVESWLAPSDMHVGGEPVKAGTWLMTVRVVSKELWEKVKRGQFTGFSVGGIAKVPG